MRIAIPLRHSITAGITLLMSEPSRDNSAVVPERICPSKPYLLAPLFAAVYISTISKRPATPKTGIKVPQVRREGARI
jgi:hypothetical protein